MNTFQISSVRILDEKKTPKSLEAIVTSYSTFMSPASKYTDTEFSSWTARLKAYGCAEVLYFLKCV